MPKLSVLIPLYNKERDIRETLQSVLRQTFSDFEIIIINDGSTDASEKVVQSISDTRITLINKKNEGVAKTRNFGVEKATTNFIVFLDADDYWYPNHLENIHSIISKYPRAYWYATAYEKKRNQQLTVPINSPIMNNGSSWIGPVDNYFKNSLVDCIAWTSAVCMKKDFFKSLNGFDTSITNGAGEDTDLWLRAALKSPLHFSTTITARHNLDGSNRISNTPTLKRDYMILDTYEEAAKYDSFLKKYLDLNRYSFALQHKLAKDKKSFNYYLKNLDLTNLNSKQRFLLKQNPLILKLLIRSQTFLEKIGIRVSSF